MATTPNRIPGQPVEFRRGAERQPVQPPVWLQNTDALKGALAAVREAADELPVEAAEVNEALLAVATVLSRVIALQASASRTASARAAEQERVAKPVVAKVVRAENPNAPADVLDSRVADKMREAKSTAQYQVELESAPQAARLAAAVVDALALLDKAIKRYELRASLGSEDGLDPDMLARVKRLVDTVPTAKRPTFCLALLEKAVDTDDKEFELALEAAVMSWMVEFVETRAAVLRPRAVGPLQAGAVDTALADATAYVFRARARRAERGQTSGVDLAKALQRRLQDVAMKTVSVDPADPASVSRGEFAQGLSNFKLDRNGLPAIDVDTGKSGARWVLRPLRSLRPLPPFGPITAGRA